MILTFDKVSISIEFLLFMLILIHRTSKRMKLHLFWGFLITFLVKMVFTLNVSVLFFTLLSCFMES